MSDVEVISALLQDAIIPGEDMTFDRAGRRFVMVAKGSAGTGSRLTVSRARQARPYMKGGSAGVRIEGVSAVAASGMPAARRGALFNLLAITVSDKTDGRWTSSSPTVCRCDLPLTAYRFLPKTSMTAGLHRSCLHMKMAE